MQKRLKQYQNLEEGITWLFTVKRKKRNDLYQDPL